MLRQKGILPPKKEDTEKVFTEDEIVNVVESTIYEKLNGEWISRLGRKSPSEETFRSAALPENW